jgi:predicted membrane channel-forming protein YqfA (hemolysin III family)
MFVAMGLSAVVPVFHGIQVFGVEQLNRQMGLSWLVTQGFLYILGAGIYAVSNYPRTVTIRPTIFTTESDKSYHWLDGWVHVADDLLTCYGYRLESPKDGPQALSTSGAARIKSFTCWSCWLLVHIWSAC